MKLVDYEYTAPILFAFDIADHFCEFAGVENVDYNKYPKEDVQKRWVRMDLEERQHLRAKKNLKLVKKAFWKSVLMSESWFWVVIYFG